MKKRLLSILLALCMVLTLLPGTAWAAEGATSGTCGDNLTWSLSGGTLTISGYGPMYNWGTWDGQQYHYAPWYPWEIHVSITSVVISDGVTSIGDCAFLSTDLSSITIPDSVTSIGDMAFRSCSKLVDITIPNSVTSIGKYAFEGCGSLTSITIPDSITSISEDTFGNCRSLTSITIPDSVTSIEDTEFINCSSLTSVTIPNSVTSIGDDALAGCSNLKKLIVPSSVVQLGGHGANGGWLSGCKNLGTAGPIGSDCDMEFGWTNSVPDCAFQGSELTSITLPNTVTKIGTSSFDRCTSLINFTIPDNVTEIGEYAFSYCQSLPNITIPDSVKTVGQQAFIGCSCLESVIIPDSVVNKGDSWFQNCPLLTSAGPIGGDYNIQYGWTDRINVSVFLGGPKLLVIPDGVTSIYAIYRSSNQPLTNIIIPSSVSYVDIDAHTYMQNDSSGLFNYLYYPGLTSAGPIGGDYSIQFGWTDTIPECAFANSSISQAVIPNGVTKIGSCAFANCKNLAEVTIPDSVTGIGSWAFRKCVNLANITIPSSVTSIGSAAFMGCASLTDITIPESVGSIGGEAFRGCTGLTSITIPSNVDYISGSTFAGCNRLAAIYVNPSNQKFSSVDGVLFTSDKKTLVAYPGGKSESYNIPGGITIIANGAFRDCNDLTSVTIPSSVTDIYGYAFDGCASLTDVYYAGSEENWQKIDINNEWGHNDPLLNATIHYNSTGPEDISHKAVSGVLRSGEGYKITWMCEYQAYPNGQIMDAIVTISAVSTDTKGEGIPLFGNNMEPDPDFIFPWELEPYNIPKSAITELRISGCDQKRLRIPEYAFQGYNRLKKLSLSFVYRIDDAAFEGCSRLELVDSSLSKLNWIGARAFADAKQLRSITLLPTFIEIGRDAFSGCPDLVISCFEDSSAHIYATDHNIPVELLRQEQGIEIPYDGDMVEIFPKNLDELITHTISTSYSPALAHMLIALSCAAYDENNIKTSLKNLGFSSKQIYTDYDSSPWIDDIAYAFGRKTLPDGKNLVLIAIRGTEGSIEWLSDFTVSNGTVFDTALPHWHTGFEDATDKVHDALKTFVGNDLGNTTFVVTGHSRGAAVGNLLSVKLRDAGVAKENVYDYNFACPDVALSNPLDWNFLGQNDNIFNISNAADPISLVPGIVGDSLVPHLWGLSWGKFGVSRWFAEDWSAVEVNLSAHDQKRYLKFLGDNEDKPSSGSFGSFKTWSERAESLMGIQNIGKMISIRCPVDVTVTDANGRHVASVIDGAVDYYDSSFGKVMIFTSADRKVIFIHGDDALTINLTATDDGTMEYAIQTVNFDSGEILSEKAFTCVELVSGKRMMSIVDAETGSDVSQVPLYVLGTNDKPEKEILPDGEGTEVPIETPIDPPASCEHEYIATLTPPTCTERGYTTHTCGKCSDSYVDSYTAALGHNYGAWTVVVPATATANGRRERVCSRCGDKQAETIPATGGSGTNTPGYGFGDSSGSSSPATYNITIPSVIGGTVSASPKSAAKGTTVTVSAVPDTGYKLVSMTALDSNGNMIALTDKGNGKYTFTMPSSKAIVDAVFQPIQTNTPEPDAPAESIWNNPYIDVVSGAWYYDAVEFVSTNGLMNGTSNSIFEPDAPLSRAMLAQILHNKEGQPTVASSVFTDVADNAWYADAVAWAAAQGIVGGYGNGLFGPDDNITREQLAVMLWRYAGKPATSQELYFNDADTVNGYAVDALCWAVEHGIINGYGNGQLEPQELATRAQVAQIFMNYLKK